MTWDINFATLSRYHEGDTITFVDDSKSKIVGIGNIKIGSSPLIEDVLIDGLKLNLLSISQLCDKNLTVIFYDSTCDVLDKKTNSCVLFGFRENNVYMIDMLNLQWRSSRALDWKSDFTSYFEWNVLIVYLNCCIRH